MAKYKIIIAEGSRQSMFINRLEHIKKQFLDERFYCLLLDAPNEEAMLDSIAAADALIVSPGMDVTENSGAKMKNCKCIVSLAVGYDNINLKASAEKGIVVCNVRDYGTEEVADAAMAFILSLARKISHYDMGLRKSDANWNWRLGIPIYRLRDKILGIIGLGRIGTAVALRSKAFGLKVYFYDPYKEDGYDKVMGVNRCGSLKELLNISDIVTVHTPLSDETKGMINKDFFNSMKKEAFLINTARGLIFENLDIIGWALKNNIISAIAADVLPQEPPDANHPLFKSWRADEEWIRNRFIISPHAAFYSEEAGLDLCSKAVVTARDAILNRPVRNIVNKEFIKADKHG